MPVVMTGVIVIAVALGVELASFAHSIAGDLRSRSIAEATALAAVSGSRSAAERIAEANGATVIDFEIEYSAFPEGSTAHVTIEMAGRRASAWASDSG